MSSHSHSATSAEDRRRVSQRSILKSTLWWVLFVLPIYCLNFLTNTSPLKGARIQLGVAITDLGGRGKRDPSTQTQQPQGQSGLNKNGQENRNLRSLTGLFQLLPFGFRVSSLATTVKIGFYYVFPFSAVTFIKAPWVALQAHLYWPRFHLDINGEQAPTSVISWITLHMLSNTTMTGSHQSHRLGSTNPG